MEKPGISIVMPCLNEKDTLATCIDKALAAMKAHGVAGEVVVADNGSTDGCPDIARAHGARVVPVSERGYGAALMGGIASSTNNYFYTTNSSQLTALFNAISTIICRPGRSFTD